MIINGKRLGFAMCGSFCTFSDCFKTLEGLISAGWDVIPIMSYNAYSTDTRFGTAAAHINRLEEMCGKKVIHTIDGAEPIGPKNMTDVMLVANCTGNTLAKLAMSITDTAVVAKRKPVLCPFGKNNKRISETHIHKNSPKTLQKGRNQKKSVL